jgi:serine/threonine protein kinase
VPPTPSARGIAMSDDVELLRDALPSYEIGEVLGRGGWGVVFGGRHRHLGREVAIKQLPATFAADPSVRRRFASEARVLAALDHPHVVPVYDYLERDDLCLLVMEQLPGGTLRERASGEGFTAPGASAVVLACAAGLTAAHARGVLHRDVKPENMLYTASGVVKVTDFGIAKVSGGAETAVTRIGDVIGTASYIAPEQVRGGALSPATDVYGLATLLYELLAGELPFDSDGDVLSVMFKHAYETPTALRVVAPDVPEPVAAVVMTGLATDPADRFASAETFATALAEAGAVAWGPGWLTRENVPVLGAPALLAAAGREPDRPRAAPAPEPGPRSNGRAHETGPLPPLPEPDRLGGPAPSAGSGPTTVIPDLIPDSGGSAGADTGPIELGSTRRRWVYVLVTAAAVVVIILTLLLLPHLVAVYPTPGR